MIAPMWRSAWIDVIPSFAFPAAIRTVIHTVDAAERLHRRLRKVIKICGSFPSDEAALKLPYFAMQHAAV